MDNFEITKIYSNNSNYTTNSLTSDNEKTFQYESNQFSIIGTITIAKINISYPILSDISKELLKISPCRFYGPMPNEKGNLCIAAHNYKNNTFFSNLSKLEIGDIIEISDNSRKNYKI